jgi:hypothetical protein
MCESGFVFDEEIEREQKVPEFSQRYSNCSFMGDKREVALSKASWKLSMKKIGSP